jgi:homoaconitase/3-isopropylmalate dehydratase large subunit
MAETIDAFSQRLVQTLKDNSVSDEAVLASINSPPEDATISSLFKGLSSSLRSASLESAAAIVDFILEKATDSIYHGGLGLDETATPTQAQYDELIFLVSAHLTSLNSRSKSRSYLSTLPTPAADTMPMTLAQKIFAQHALSPIPSTGLPIHSVLRVGIDWIMASELSWAEMARTHTRLGNPGIWRNDRFYLAGDHIVHPDVMHIPRVQAMKETAEKAKTDFKMTEYQGMNYTIMHTEFVREKVEPGQIVIGSDSHTCSGGAVGALSIGFGAADVMMTLALGETWFKVPESVKIEFVGKPNVGVSGKDVILHILGELKRNTVASERIVEFMGEGSKHLSVDARFAICNMCTEFGAVTGTFVADEVTKAYIDKRRRKANKLNSVYFKPDAGAKYASEHVIDLSKVQNTIAVYPEPDHIVPVSEMAEKKLDGVFIGACTTTEEELVLAALVLKIGLAKKLPMAKGKRHYVPGSLPIVDRLGKLGLLEVYEQAGFTRGPPGCSYCVGLSAEKAEKGETWLSSQNRNFKNRMGAGTLPSTPFDTPIQANYLQDHSATSHQP